MSLIKKITGGMCLAAAVSASVSYGHPLAEPHNRDTIGRYYDLDLTPEVIEKEVEVEVIREVEKPIDAWGVISLNVIGEDGDVDAHEYVEFEGGLVVGNFDLYGFVDIADESSFIKLNPTYFIGETNWFANYTLKHSTAETDFTVLGEDVDINETNHYAGMGYKFNLPSGGFIKTSLNFRHTDLEGEVEIDDMTAYAGAKGTNGYALLTTFVQPISATYNVQVEGWVDAHFGMEEEFGDVEQQVMGNIGIRKSFNNGMYGRVGYQFNQHDGAGDDFGAASLQVGYKF